MRRVSVTRTGAEVPARLGVRARRAPISRSEGLVAREWSLSLVVDGNDQLQATGSRGYSGRPNPDTSRPPEA